MSHEPNAPFLFIIDTADYAGNFERDLCAYITGCYGDCGVGRDIADLYFDEEAGKDTIENVTTEPDEHGCHRPVTLYRSSNGKNNSVAILYEKKPTKAQIETMKRRAYKFALLKDAEWYPDGRISKILGFRLLKQKIIREIKEIKV